MNWTWLLTIASIIGVIANIKKKRWCFIVWIITNFAWMLVNFHIKLYSASCLFLVYFILAVWGLIEWGKPKKVEAK